MSAEDRGRTVALRSGNQIPTKTSSHLFLETSLLEATVA